MNWNLLVVLLCVTVFSIFAVIEVGRTVRVRIMADPCTVTVFEGEMV